MNDYDAYREPRLPYETQMRRYESRREAALDSLIDFINDNFEEILEEMDHRFVVGYNTYDSVMYNWPPNIRKKNVLEELADAAIYTQSGKLEEET